MEFEIEAGWNQHLKNEFQQDYFKSLWAFVEKEYASSEIYPPKDEIFKALNKCPFDQVKVVILGQDPYHGPGQANGLCFSVKEGVRPPPSLKNIFKEIEADIGKTAPANGALERWAEQGVLLLNATLTVRAEQAGSHQKKGWEKFTDAAIQKLAAERTNIAYILWGSYAQKKASFVNSQENLVLKSAHPSPLSARRGFFGSAPFSQVNAYLESVGGKPIDW